VADPFGAAERGDGGEDVSGKGAAQQILGELLTVADIPNLDEIGGMCRVHKGVFGLAEEEGIIDRIRLVEEREEQEGGEENGGRRQAKCHVRGLAR
jgi:hypothetical protein